MSSFVMVVQVRVESKADERSRLTQFVVKACKCRYVDCPVEQRRNLRLHWWVHQLAPVV